MGAGLPASEASMNGVQGPSDGTRPPLPRGTGDLLRFAAIGLEFFSPIVAGILGGYYLGEYLHMPWIGLIGLIGGAAMGFYRLIVEVRAFMNRPH
ncbi:MAG TPA: AtpZ/AtpI family protein [Candidatus Binataceae bacterium]|nr:AtpZ/AtpI family protein [Candidatus Binataceae bacterium]